MPFFQDLIVKCLIMTGCFLMGFAGVHLAMEKQEDRMLLATVDQIVPQQENASLPSKHSNARGHAVLVPLEHEDRALMVKTTLDHKKSAYFILDTGATYTAISQEMAKQLGYDTRHAETVTITTANGQVKLPRILLKSLTLNGHTVHNVEATVMPLPKTVPFSGLLGLSFVKRYRVTIDSQAEQLVIEPHQDAS